MNEASNATDRVAAGLIMAPGLIAETTAPRFTYTIDCIGADGEVKWTEAFENLVTTAGKNALIDNNFKASAYTAAWYLGLKGAGAPVIADTMASHVSWSEVTPYTGNRLAITFGTTSAGSNAATAVSYAVTLAGPTTVAGAFVATTNTGATGTLYSAGDFATSRSVISGDTLNVTLTVSVT